MSERDAKPDNVVHIGSGKRPGFSDETAAHVRAFIEKALARGEHIAIVTIFDAGQESASETIEAHAVAARTPCTELDAAVYRAAHRMLTNNRTP